MIDVSIITDEYFIKKMLLNNKKDISRFFFNNDIFNRNIFWGNFGTNNTELIKIQQKNDINAWLVFNEIERINKFSKTDDNERTREIKENKIVSCDLCLFCFEPYQQISEDNLKYFKDFQGNSKIYSRKQLLNFTIALLQEENNFNNLSIHNQSLLHEETPCEETHLLFKEFIEDKYTIDDQEFIDFKLGEVKSCNGY